MTQATRFGVNYVPSKGWWYSWSDWNDQDFQDDFQAIAQLGCDHVRVHCLWPLLQPNPGMVSNTMLDRLVRLLDLAEANGMDVIVTVFNGWLSGFDFRPSWLHDNVNIFTDEAAITAQLSLLDSLAKRVGTHPRFLGFDVANEPCVLATSTKNVTTQPQGDAWVRTLLDHCQQLAPGKLHSVGMDHAPWLAADVPFGRPTLANTGGLTPIHAWSYFTGALEQYGPLGTGTLHLAEFMLELAKAFQDDPTRPVWLQEYGVANDWMTAQERETYVDKATRSALSVANLWGITWWCSHDINRELTGFVELEYDLGLLTGDNHVKPTGARFASIIAEVKAGSVAEPQPRNTALILDDDQTPDLTFADRFFAVIDSGESPAIILRSKANDDRYLASRGITAIV
ncbi:cellulase family glycosylhydrolase [Paenarthrobacter sp. AMU7]|uniref:Cellulase family glycosylhydrolase n=1 Tax=Paenarthrobacter sp. AMU7 TaxID=3162492 RepID=A0AB39YN80_9MICC